MELYYDNYGQYPSDVDSDTSDVGRDHSDKGDGFIMGLVDTVRGDNSALHRLLASSSADPVNISDANHCGGTGNDLVYTQFNPNDDRQKYQLCFSAETDLTGKGYTFACDNGNYPVWCLVRQAFSGFRILYLELPFLSIYTILTPTPTISYLLIRQLVDQ